MAVEMQENCVTKFAVWNVLSGTTHGHRLRGQELEGHQEEVQGGHQEVVGVTHVSPLVTRPKNVGVSAELARDLDILLTFAGKILQTKEQEQEEQPKLCRFPLLQRYQNLNQHLKNWQPRKQRSKKETKD